MNTLNIQTTYLGEKRFASGDGVAAVTMDAGEQAGGLGEAPNPKMLVLHGLAGCTGLDVVSILAKKKVSFDKFDLTVSATQGKVHPVVFKTIVVTYTFVGDEADRKHYERAIELSESQFCGVSSMLAKSAEITSELVIVPR